MADPLTLEALHRGDDDDDRGLGPVGSTAALLALAGPLLYGFGSEAGVLRSLVAGVGGALLMWLAAAFGAGLLDGPVGRRWAMTASWSVVGALGAVFWWSAELQPWAAAVFTAITAAGLGWLVAQARGDRDRFGLAPATIEHVLAVSGRLDGARRAALEDGLSTYATVHRWLSGVLAEDALITPRAMHGDATRSLAALATQLELAQALAESARAAETETTRAAADRAQRAADTLLSELHGARDALLTYAATRGDGDGDVATLRERVEHLRAAAVAIEEVAGADR